MDAVKGKDRYCIRAINHVDNAQEIRYRFLLSNLMHKCNHVDIAEESKYSNMCRHRRGD